MFKEVVRSLDSGLLPIIGLIAFVVAFVLIVVWVFTLKKEQRDAAKQMPLNDPQDVSIKKNHSYANN